MLFSWLCNLEAILHNVTEVIAVEFVSQMLKFINFGKQGPPQNWTEKVSEFRLLYEHFSQEQDIKVDHVIYHRPSLLIAGGIEKKRMFEKFCISKVYAKAARVKKHKEDQDKNKAEAPSTSKPTDDQRKGKGHGVETDNHSDDDWGYSIGKADLITELHKWLEAHMFTKTLAIRAANDYDA
ncbi:hypothetical protein M422DRAFT_260040 [Sphaerobolus stellatus SS14]|uniref:Uncharacterized protein n=1 Tax=Sphaerobolus stellatus (strain SS14) TaxID=990650 RepID=A0A0C9URG2_SPHS4|nr:hypothetical protein M422DRAFT_260040 [Sphaerobolus stellatus SS14]